ncbi:MAG: 2-hydroxychromene-2-carboxylate isomerase [Rhodobacteraceae bacterium]|nr:2-hydroxychromene-2-carboxylate isomerase [Paracoccaceae bacterium]
MPQPVEFIFDFGSPNAYFAYKTLPDICARTGAELKYTPALLGGVFKATNNQPPMMAFGNVKGKLDYERLEIKRFIKKHKLFDFKFNSAFPVNTLILMRAAIAAQDQGILEPYVAAGMTAMWETDKDMSNPEVFAAEMSAAGLDGPALLEATQDPEIKGKLATHTEAAVNRGVFGMPTFFVGDEMFYGKERLGQVEDEILAQG